MNRDRVYILKDVIATEELRYSLRSVAQMRSIYGNLTGCKVIDRRDVKVNSLSDIPYGMDFVSTNDKTFAYGNVGQYIRDLFEEPSRFEV